jgi:putative FmdB family regulatory protein
VPLYEYRCKQCGHQFEKIQSFSAPDEKECPVCKGEVEKLISASSFQFKGAGWYVNDYAAKGGSKPSGAKDSDGSKPAASTSENKSSGSSSDSTSSAAAPAPSTTKSE